MVFCEQMIKYTSGNILDAKTKAIVNTVNCEGFMGKGIAYQFKLRFPENNEEYVKRCNSNQFNIGDILMFEEDGKTIMNFPTKDKWRKKSEYTFIEKGLLTLKKLLIENNIDSISIPPLGCGNGGLKWPNVKKMIEDEFQEISRDIEIIIYEPLFDNRTSYKNKVKKAPTLSSSHLLLMKFKMNLVKFNKVRLQKTAFLNNIISNQDYFKFQGQNFGPYAHSIDVLSRDIKEFQNHYGINTKEAFNKGYETLISKNFNSKIENFNCSLDKTLSIVNSIDTDLELELLTTVLFIIKNNSELNLKNIVEQVHSWNEHKKASFNSNNIEMALEKLMKLALVKKTLYNTFELSAIKSTTSFNSFK
ncbi:macro domain-containing protein [Zunongwangia pacifica]|uniref:Macro domain-containing protein n=1 Tax=Zunongwangia pacifica TaxID=2911062 RepID=A0A9X1ZWC9_9FLAO|nr:macro domain-containing protein [Zunongwangia pacifica]MCL6220435.1 macro domain-containing protein [Zunongwangia pacifica]